MNPYVAYNTEYNILICKEHQYAVSFKTLARHFLEKHPDILLPIRQNIITYASQFLIKDASDLQQPQNCIHPISYLEIIDGFSCEYEKCGKILTSLEIVKKHCRLKHEWKAKNGECWVVTRAQTFYQGNGQRFVD
jgi:hypothetical protein